jgi:hemerythrin
LFSLILLGSIEYGLFLKQISMKEVRMPYIEWDDSLSVGVEVIDKQHMRIVDYINKLHEITHGDYAEADRRQQTLSVFKDAVDYTESHFGFEESAMEEANYPYLKAHTRVHLLFVRRVMGYQERLAKGEDIAQELLETLSRWLINHIKNEDKDYSKWLVGPEKEQSVTQDQGWLSRQIQRFFGSAG